MPSFLREGLLQRLRDLDEEAAFGLEMRSACIWLSSEAAL